MDAPRLLLDTEWYGSCPSITTLVSSNEHALNALKREDAGGKTVVSLYELATDCMSLSHVASFVIIDNALSHVCGKYVDSN